MAIITYITGTFITFVEAPFPLHLLPPIQSCSSKFWVWSCIASNFDKGCRGDHKHKTMDTPFMPKYGTVSQVLLQLVVALCTVFNFPFVYFYGTATKWILWNKAVWWLVYLVFDWGKFIYDYVSRLHSSVGETFGVSDGTYCILKKWI